MSFRLNNRLDVLDNNRKWLEAFVIEIVGHELKVHFKGYTSAYDEIIDTSQEYYRIKEVGSYSKGEGWAKHSL